MDEIPVNAGNVADLHHDIPQHLLFFQIVQNFREIALVQLAFFRFVIFARHVQRRDVLFLTVMQQHDLHERPGENDDRFLVFHQVIQKQFVQIALGNLAVLLFHLSNMMQQRIIGEPLQIFDGQHVQPCHPFRRKLLWLNLLQFFF